MIVTSFTLTLISIISIAINVANICIVQFYPSKWIPVISISTVLINLGALIIFYIEKYIY